MNTANGRLSLWRILRRDGLAVWTAFPFAVLWAFSLLLAYFDAPKIRPFTIAAAAATLVSLPLLVSRMIVYVRLFARGREVAGKVVSVTDSSSWLGGGDDVVGSSSLMSRVRYSYTFQGRTYEGSGVVRGWKHLGYQGMMDAAELRPGQEIRLLVDEEQPSRSIMRNLFAAGEDSLLRV